jgi:hypothetical protein
MISILLGPHGRVIPVFKELILTQVCIPNSNTGKTWLSLSSRETGTFAESILIANTEQQFMAPI